MLQIKLLQALYGDCIVLSYGQDSLHHIIIDGGTGRLCYRQLQETLHQVKEAQEHVDLLVLTHIDSDHISGFIRLFSQKSFPFHIIKRMWFNFGKSLNNSLRLTVPPLDVTLRPSDSKISWKQGESLEALLGGTSILRESLIKKMDIFEISGARITVLSPSQDTLKLLAVTGISEPVRTTQISGSNDYNRGILKLNSLPFDSQVSLTNRSSIAFLFQYCGFTLLFLGDAAADEIEDSFMRLGYSCQNKIKIDYCKIAHHASKHNTSNQLIQMMDCHNFIISTHKTSQGRPSKECLSRIICNTKEPVTFYCNYNLNAESIFTKQELDTYKMKFITLDENGITV